jgi:hypothetical protein
MEATQRSHVSAMISAQLPALNPVKDRLEDLSAQG